MWHIHFAAYHAFNGCGEMTGMHWLAESGLLCYPIALTITHHVGTVHEALVAYGQEKGLTDLSALAVVAETWDGWLNDLDAFHITREHVYEAIAAARPGPVAVHTLPGHQMNPLFSALAETMSGYKGRTAQALPLDRLQAAMAAMKVP